SAVQSGTWKSPIPGPAYGFGTNSSGQLGLGSSSLYSPVTSPDQPTAKVSGGYTFSQITVSPNFTHACGITASTGAAYCWGENTFGELGNGTATSSNVPVAVSGGLAFAQIS